MSILNSWFIKLHSIWSRFTIYLYTMKVSLQTTEHFSSIVHCLLMKCRSDHWLKMCISIAETIYVLCVATDASLNQTSKHCNNYVSNWTITLLASITASTATSIASTLLLNRSYTLLHTHHWTKVSECLRDQSLRQIIDCHRDCWNELNQ